VAIALAAVILAAYLLTGGFGLHGKSSPDVLVRKGTYYSLPGGQFNAVAFLTSSSDTILGTVWDTWGINIYLMTPTEVVDLAKKGVVTGYSWTSGHVANLTETDLSIVVEPGSWDLVFLNTDNPSINPIYTNVTIVGFYTDVTLSPT